MRGPWVGGYPLTATLPSRFFGTQTGCGSKTVILIFDTILHFLTSDMRFSAWFTRVGLIFSVTHGATFYPTFIFISLVFS